MNNNSKETVKNLLREGKLIDAARLFTSLPKDRLNDLDLLVKQQNQFGNMPANQVPENEMQSGQKAAARLMIHLHEATK